MNEREINSIIQELMDAEPQFAPRHEFLRTAIGELVRSRPQVSVDPLFVAGLRARLMITRVPVRSPWKMFSLVAVPGVAIIAVIILVLSRGVMIAPIPTTVGPIAAVPAPQAPASTPSIAAIPSTVTTLSPEAFGRLAMATETAQPMLKKTSAPVTNAPVAPTARLMSIQAVPAPEPTLMSEPTVSYTGDEQKNLESAGYVFRIKNLIPPISGVALYDKEGNRLVAAQTSVEGVSYERSQYQLQNDWATVVEGALATARTRCADISCSSAEVLNLRKGLLLVEKTDLGNILAPAYVFDMVFDGKKDVQYIVVPLVK